MNTKPAFSAYRVLIVDDDEDMLMLLGRMLRRIGFSEINTAGSAREAEDLMRVKNYHLLLTDHLMTGPSGMELLKRLRSGGLPLATDPDVPVIMITGRGERDIVLEARGAGVSAFLVKPVESRQLEAKVSSVLFSPR